MFKLIVSEKGGASKEIEFDKDEITIGRVPGNDIVLPGNNVSKRHSRVVRQGDRFYVVDLKSTNGTYLNGRRIMTPSPLSAGDKIFVGNFVVVLDGEPGAIASGEGEVPMEAGSLVEPIPLDDPPESQPPPPMDAPAGAPGPTVRPTFAGGPAVRQSQSTQPMSTAPALAASLGMGQPKQNLSSTMPQGSPMSQNPLRPSTAGMGGVQTPALRPAGQTPPPATGGGAQSTPPPPAGPAQNPTRPAMNAQPRPGAPSAPSMGGVRPATGATGAPASSAGWPQPGGAATSATPRGAATPTPAAVAAPNAGAATAVQPELKPSHPTLPEPINAEDAPPAILVPPATSAASAVAVESPKPTVNAPTLSVASQVVDAVIQTHRAGIEPTPPSHEYAALLASVVADAKEAGVNGAGSDMGDAATRARVRSVVENLARRKNNLPAGITHDRLIRDVVAEMTGAGAIELALDEMDVTSIFVSPNGRVSVGRSDAAGPSPYWFSSSSAVTTAVDRLLKIAGVSRIGDQSFVEGILGDGARMTVVYAAGASAPSVAIERAPRRAPAMADLVAKEVCSSAVVTLLQRALESRRNLIVVGPRGSGRTTLVAALVSHSANNGERVVALEHRPELGQAHRDVVSVPVGKDSKRAVDVANAMRPQRLIYAHVDDHSAAALAGNLVTGAEGVIAVLDGASPESALHRWAATVAANSHGATKEEILRQIAATRPLLVQLTRLGDGTVRVVSVAEAGDNSGKGLQIDEFFRLQVGAQNDRGRLSAQWTSTGQNPSFLR